MDKVIADDVSYVFSHVQYSSLITVGMQKLREILVQPLIHADIKCQLIVGRLRSSGYGLLLITF